MNESSNEHYLDLSHSKFDTGRFTRIGIPEAVYAPGKTPEQCKEIVENLLLTTKQPIIVTRADPAHCEVLMDLNPTSFVGQTLTWAHANKKLLHEITIISGGTADQFVVEECRSSLLAMGGEVKVLNDVGVAGIHRLLDVVPQISEKSLVVAVAGMEASLPTVLAGLIPNPIIAVPTSTGYGASLDGVTASLSILSSCSPGINLVGIDNGYGAACAAMRILNLLDE